MTPWVLRLWKCVETYHFLRYSHGCVVVRSYSDSRSRSLIAVDRRCVEELPCQQLMVLQSNASWALCRSEDAVAVLSADPISTYESYRYKRLLSNRRGLAISTRSGLFEEKWEEITTIRIFRITEDRSKRLGGMLLRL